ncbi:hypothetical protein I4F81_007627 [Pyropia yezoensis]|uniref:Uncharacterized protein n=1 Tax=Pyropia yezoensis TaxID=2788 RepID=A0ACC3C5M1_PYRYE|nr:hypothetical protein I4F81_007627 [Neopyropia yezoensis]
MWGGAGRRQTVVSGAPPPAPGTVAAVDASASAQPFRTVLGRVSAGTTGVGTLLERLVTLRCRLRPADRRLLLAYCRQPRALLGLLPHLAALAPAPATPAAGAAAAVAPGALATDPADPARHARTVAALLVHGGRPLTRGLAATSAGLDVLLGTVVSAPTAGDAHTAAAVAVLAAVIPEAPAAVADALARRPAPSSLDVYASPAPLARMLTAAVTAARDGGGADGLAAVAAVTRGLLCAAPLLRRAPAAGCVHTDGVERAVVGVLPALVPLLAPAAVPGAVALEVHALLAATVAAGGAATAAAVAAAGVPAALAARLRVVRSAKGGSSGGGGGAVSLAGSLLDVTAVAPVVVAAAASPAGGRLTAALCAALAPRLAQLWRLSAAGGPLERLGRGGLAAMAVALRVPAVAVEARGSSPRGESPPPPPSAARRGDAVRAAVAVAAEAAARLATAVR